MNTDLLRAFTAVAETGSFSHAAERLHLTQPAVSKRIAALEGALGHRLFDRIGRRVMLTEAGRALLPRARALLAQIEDTRRAIANLSGRIAGRLRVGSSHHVGLHRLPPVLRSYTLRYPDVELALRFMESEAACRAVERGDLELAIVTLPPQPAPPLRADAVWPDPMAVVCARDHPLARGARLQPAALRRWPAILPGTATYTRQLIDAALARAGVRPRVSLSTNYLETIKMMVSVGLGWSVLPKTMVDRALQIVPVTGLTVERTLGVVRHDKRTLSNSATALLETLLGRPAPRRI